MEAANDHVRSTKHEIFEEKREGGRLIWLLPSLQRLRYDLCS
jgi:hypothetical protein